MDNILPFILETLSNKPLSEETEKNLIKELRLKFKNEDIKISDFKKNFNQAIEMGQDLGIFRLKGENIKLPFSLGNKRTKSESKSSLSKSAVTDKERRSSRRGRGRSSSRRRQSRSRSRSRSGARSRSQRRRRVSRR